ncbi:probable RNA-binding protein 19, partial [Vombatus ursinus]|uniref:probable RNA-binding protein 19 n=1 Tax=Vombatus ursinus TaxID=29139 RepID=UPI000FFD550A
VFSKVGTVKSCTVSKKKNKAGVLLSMGFGFVEYRKPEQAQKALRQLQGCMVDDHKLEVKISERAVKPVVTSARQKQTARKQKTSKILVRNIPFQANVREIRELFRMFGALDLSPCDLRVMAHSLGQKEVLLPCLQKAPDAVYTSWEGSSLLELAY